MNIKPIKNKKDYKEALKRVDEIWDAKRGTKKGNELEVLSILIEKYEQEHFAIFAPDPVEAIKFRMEQMGLDRKDLSDMIGANRVSEIFKGKRRLSINMIRILRDKLNLSADFLVR